MDVNELQRSITEARKHSHPRILVVINPGNPTGNKLLIFYYLYIIMSIPMPIWICFSYFRKRVI